MGALIKLVAAIAVTAADMLWYVLSARCVVVYYTVFVLCHWREVLIAILSQDWQFQVMLFIILAIVALAHGPHVN